MIQYTKTASIIKKLILETSGDSSLTRKGTELTLNVEPTDQGQTVRLYGVIYNKYPRVGDWCIKLNDKSDDDIVKFDETMDKEEYYTVVMSSYKGDSRFRHYTIHDVITFVERNDGTIVNHIIANCSKHSLYPDIER